MKFCLAYKFIIELLVLLLVTTSCQDIPRDNVLDPKNPDSYTASTVLIEAFVNTSNPLPYNDWALSALNEMANLYGNEVIICEYHRDTDQYPDPYTIPLISEALYTKYVDNSDPSLKGVPDIFINGISGRVQGASSIATVAARLNDIVAERVILTNHFTLEPQEPVLNNTSITAGCNIARLGNKPSEDLVLRLILVRKIDNDLLKRVVLDFEKSDIIQSLNAGEIRTISFDGISFSEQPDKIIFSLTSADGLIIYQTVEVAL
jgi:hypothetical protein